jgi:hypothetical protein
MLFALWISGVGGLHGQMSQSQQEGLGEGRAGIGRAGRGGEAWRGHGRGRGNGAGARRRGENSGDDPLEGGEEGGCPLSPSTRCPLPGGPDDIYRREWVHKSDSGFPRDNRSGGGSRDRDQSRSRSPPGGRDQNSDTDRFEGTRTMQLQQRRDLVVPGLVHGGRGLSGLEGFGGVQGVGLYQHEDPRPQQNAAQQNTVGGDLERVQRLALLASQMLQQSQQSGAAGALQSSAVNLRGSSTIVDLGGSSTIVDNGLLGIPAAPTIAQHTAGVARHTAGVALHTAGVARHTAGVALHTAGANWSTLQSHSSTLQNHSQSTSAVASRLPALQGLQGLQTASNFSLPLNRGDFAPLSRHPAAAAVAAAATVSAPFSASSNYALSARQKLFFSPLFSHFMW